MQIFVAFLSLIHLCFKTAVFMFSLLEVKFSLCDVLLKIMQIYIISSLFKIIPAIFSFIPVMRLRNKQILPAKALITSSIRPKIATGELQ